MASPLARPRARARSSALARPRSHPLVRAPAHSSPRACRWQGLISPADKVAVVGDGKLGLLIAEVLGRHAVERGGPQVVQLGRHMDKMSLVTPAAFLTYSTAIPTSSFWDYAGLYHLQNNQKRKLLKYPAFIQVDGSPLQAGEIVADLKNVLETRGGDWGWIEVHIEEDIPEIFLS